ncbi:hypothetical protein [Arcanobacterium buesumense]|uniref:Uncharacterized protein n=1 Tax=Arcanobacterium buesumense TaxID=2722751 RepID=A0A6H2EKB2_9ACTO|nr:hypothetical protein [Arcanobacterium buesumense]QJC21251.1 hypothetical protein HC352_01100 [Arcanobacterium buesumense]
MTTPTSAHASLLSNRVVIVLIVFLVLVTIAGGGIWRWGQHLNYWGTPPALASLMNEKVAHPDQLGIETDTVWHTPSAGFLGKSRPYEVRYQSTGSIDVEKLTELTTTAEQDGWVADNSCAAPQLWCATKKTAGEPTKWLTISSQEVIGNSGKNIPIAVSITYY